jgi:GT2 family glycosyltransferase
LSGQSLAGAHGFVAASQSLREQGRLVEAKAALSEGRALYPDDVPLLIELVRLHNVEDAEFEGRSDVSALETERPSVDIIVCVHNALDEIRKCLESISAKTPAPYFLTIIDDGSEPDVGRYLNAFANAHDEARVFTNVENIGYARSANRGIRAARGDWIVLLNSDAIVTTGWLQGLLDCALTDKKIAGVGPLSNAASIQTIRAARRLPAATAPETMAGLVRRISKKRYPKVPFLSGFCTLLSMSALTEIGYLDETTFSGYGIDDDMSLRLLKAGYKLCIADDVYVHHLSAASFGKGDKRDRLIAEAREKLKARWPGYNFDLIKEAAAFALNEIKTEITAPIELPEKIRAKEAFSNRLMRLLGRRLHLGWISRS